MTDTAVPLDPFTHLVHQRLRTCCVDPMPAFPTVIHHARRHRTITLRHAADAQLQLRIPARTSVRRFATWLTTNQEWLIHSIHRLSRAVPVLSACDITHGALLPVQGVLVPVAIEHRPRGRVSVAIAADAVHIAWSVARGAATSAHLRPHVHDAYRRAAHAAWLPRIAAGANQLGVPHVPLRITDPTQRWGSCSPHLICLSWRLFAAPPWVADYVIWHELCHLREMNHSPTFWSLLRVHAPDTAAARAWLRCCGSTLHQLLGAV